MEYFIFLAVIAAAVLIIFLNAEREYKKKEQNLYQSLKNHYGKPQKKEYFPGKMDIIKKYFERFQEDSQIDDITWNDLNLDEVYKRINYTHCSAGEEYLYYLLRVPVFNESELDYRENLIEYYRNHEKERVDIQYEISHLGYSGKKSVYDYLDSLEHLGKRSNFKHVLAIILLILSLLLCIWFPVYGILAAVAVLIYNFITYFKEKNEIQPYIVCFAYILRLLKIIKRVNAAVSDSVLKEKFDTGKLTFSRFKRGSFWIMSSGRMSGSGNPLDVLLDYIRMSLHLDLMKFNVMLFEVRSHLTEIYQLISAVGFLDSVLAIGEYRASLENWCIPVVSETFEFKELCHPLLPEAVSNSLCVKKGILLTGSNASGKSTFLKTVAVNAIFAQTIHTCLASGYASPFYSVYSSMALKDNVVSGESYYIVEIKSMKRILDRALTGNRRILCFVDEVLRGTNTVERIAASTQILKCLARENVICFAATHDLELAGLLKDEYDNYHFQEEIEGEDVHFSYKILPGKATTKNAIKLLKVMGYRDSVVNCAETMAEKFTETGVWTDEKQKGEIYESDNLY